MRKWITNEHVDANVLQTIRSGVIETGRELARTYGGYAQPIACAVTERSSLIGGVTGRTEFNRLFIDYLWIDPQWRLRGLAAEALHKIEALAAQRGCIDAIIETTSPSGINGWAMYLSRKCLGTAVRGADIHC
jgi:GNAT superfamily N-acetyltransferase